MGDAAYARPSLQCGGGAQSPNAGAGIRRGMIALLVPAVGGAAWHSSRNPRRCTPLSLPVAAVAASGIDLFARLPLAPADQLSAWR